MWLKWLPWRYIVSQLAKSHGFIDPLLVWSRLHRFAQPSEVAEPIELLRAGVIFHARGLVNARAIQHNLDWVWPFWIERQFDPADDAFIPRSFSITHINLTHRNWTAVGQPDLDWLPLVDPRGLLTPFFDSWSLDAWIVPASGPPLLPSRTKNCRQQLLLAGGGLSVTTAVEENGHALECCVDVANVKSAPVCRLRVVGRSRRPGWLVIAFRPVNPEGVSFIHSLETEEGGSRVRLDDGARVHFAPCPERVCMSTYRAGDVLQNLPAAGPAKKITCNVGMATAAALFALEPDRAREVIVHIPARRKKGGAHEKYRAAISMEKGENAWEKVLAGSCRVELPEPLLVTLFDAAVRTLVLLSPGDVYPGPYTYKRFWFRDAAFLVNALLALGLLGRARRALRSFPGRQTTAGYFHSQDGEWDSNGEALWIADRFRRYSNEPLPSELLHAVTRGSWWIKRKRTSDALPKPHAGLLPAGFSAEHLGPNDFYYWDDFWGAAGLRSGAALLREGGNERLAGELEAEAKLMLRAIDRSLEATAGRRSLPGVPASPYRRMDAGAIGSIVCSYPLQLWPPGEPRLMATVEFLLQKCMVAGGFFQDMIHSGINPYLTLHLAQVLLRAGDSRYFDLLRAVADLASPTGQWPEAIHPHTRGGCMGDGQHGWASAEWVLMIRNLFVREEQERLVLGSGFPAAWLSKPGRWRLGPTGTLFGPVTVEVQVREDSVVVGWQADWHGLPPPIEVRLAGFGAVAVPAGEQPIILLRSRE